VHCTDAFIVHEVYNANLWMCCEVMREARWTVYLKSVFNSFFCLRYFFVWIWRIQWCPSNSRQKQPTRQILLFPFYIQPVMPDRFFIIYCCAEYRCHFPQTLRISLNTAAIHQQHWCSTEDGRQHWTSPTSLQLITSTEYNRWHFKFSRQKIWRWLSSGMLCHTVW
jgi:hypothetical protein